MEQSGREGWGGAERMGPNNQAGWEVEKKNGNRNESRWCDSQVVFTRISIASVTGRGVGQRWEAREEEVVDSAADFRRQKESKIVVRRTDEERGGVGVTNVTDLLELNRDQHV